MSIYLGSNKVALAGTNGGFMINGRLLTTQTYSFNLGQTNYNELVANISTTAQAITLPATDYSSAGSSIICIRVGEDYGNITIDRTKYDYVIFSTVQINYDYGSNNVSSTIHPVRFAYSRDFQEGRYINSVDSSTGVRSSTLTFNNSNITATGALLYQKANNTYAIYNTYSYGIYGISTPSIATLDNKDIINITASGFAVKAHNSYCPVASLQAVNPSTTIITIACEIYEGDKSSYGNIYNRAYELAANS